MRSTAKPVRQHPLARACEIVREGLRQAEGFARDPDAGALYLRGALVEALRILGVPPA